MTDLCCSMPNLFKEEVRASIFHFIHQMFIEEPDQIPSLMKQTFPIAFIDDFVKNVPSMHVCLDLIPDLLNSSERKVVVFALTLFGSLAKLYPISKSFQQAKSFVIQLIYHMTSQLSTYCKNARAAMDVGCPIPLPPASEPHLPMVVPILSDIAKAFPILAEELGVLLKSITLPLSLNIYRGKVQTLCVSTEDSIGVESFISLQLVIAHTFGEIVRTVIQADTAI
ncbi:integrator complex subunit 2-domain-containing protein [Phlyctochytrium arcticum]|nr:integrator complex subunit 2-domain-containing protein [Phlyctochytrium arcticum]